MYNYQTEKQKLFTDQGQVMFLKVRDRVNMLLDDAGAAMMMYAHKGISGDSWELIACLDRMIELKEIREITKSDTPGQYRVFVKS